MCVVLIAVIGLIVPSDHWLLPPWKWAIFGLAIAAFAGLTTQLFLQSREDDKRDEKDAKRDQIQQNLVAQLEQLAPKATDTSKGLMAVATGSPQPLSPPVLFDAANYFRTAYHSLLTEDVEKRIRIAAEQNKPYCSPEDFYTKFIGTGLVAYIHDITWAYIFKSQILMLTELNRRGGFLPISDAQAFYHQAVTDYPNIYTNYSFQQWMNFMLEQGLFIAHPSNMLEITVRGRDFLAYSGHNSRTADQKSG